MTIKILKTPPEGTPPDHVAFKLLCVIPPHKVEGDFSCPRSLTAGQLVDALLETQEKIKTAVLKKQRATQPPAVAQKPKLVRPR